MENRPIEEIKKENKILKIYQDENAESPRSWDNLGKMVLKHNRYDFPNELNIPFSNYSNTDELQKFLKKEYKAVVILPIYLYDHSGLWLKTSKFLEDSQGWDTSFIGFIIATKEDIIKEFKKIDKKTLEIVEQSLIEEVEVYSQYLSGDVYFYILVKPEKCKCCNHINEKTLDSCGGYYGSDSLDSIKKELGF